MSCTSWIDAEWITCLCKLPTIMWCTCGASCDVYVAHLVHTATLDLYNKRLGEVWVGNPLDVVFHEAPQPTGCKYNCIIYINIFPIFIYTYKYAYVYTPIWIHVAYTHLYIYIQDMVYVCAHWHPSCTAHVGHVVRLCANLCGASYASSHTLPIWTEIVWSLSG